MKRLKNDDTLTKLGDIYHYLLVLKHCCSLRENEVIFVEQFGDISKISSDDSFQMEVKHHVDEHNMVDRDSEFWNTLKNWLINKEEMKRFKSYILLTTSIIDEESAFYDWESKSADERLSKLKEVGMERRKKEKTFRELYDKIFNTFTEEEIKLIISRVALHTGENNITLIRKEIQQHPHFQNVSEDDFDSYVNELLGYVINKPTTPPFAWHINFSEFKSLTIELRDRFANNGRIIPSKYGGKELSNVEKYLDHKFVQEIIRIKYDNQVKEAINDVWRKNSTVIEYFNDNLIFFDDVKSYKNGLSKKLNHIKENYVLDLSEKEENHRIKGAKKFFNKAMTMELENFGMIKSNTRFFQNGVIHEIVDDGNVYWYIEEDENE
ncbi:ABC-three component system protein [Bacillus sp. FJAT-29814]|uniref:ABC-three component system protein n=1 Tax=Bacillus sp. FJAT-29814 TaxID=1729688 RepID=UPI00083080C6|nr:ABC-three component system protein [Bacillus sp. FJAT-29814]